MRQRGRSDPVRRRGLLVLSRPAVTWPGVTAAIVGPGIATGIRWPPASNSRESAPSIWQRWPWRSPEGSGSACSRSPSPDTTTSSSSLRTRSGSRLRATRSSQPRCFSWCAVVVAQIVERLRARSRTPRARCRRSRSSEQRRSLAREQEAVAELGRLALTGSALTDLFERAVEEIGTRSRRSLRGGARGERRSQRARRARESVFRGGSARRVLVSQETPEGQVLIANKPLLFERGEAAARSPALPG